MSLLYFRQPCAVSVFFGCLNVVCLGLRAHLEEVEDLPRQFRVDPGKEIDERNVGSLKALAMLLKCQSDNEVRVGHLHRPCIERMWNDLSYVRSARCAFCASLSGVQAIRHTSISKRMKPEPTTMNIKSKILRGRLNAEPDSSNCLSSIAAEFAKGKTSIANFLNPEHLEDLAKTKEIARQLQAGEVVVLRDAFQPEFAEIVYRELRDGGAKWERFTGSTVGTHQGTNGSSLSNSRQLTTVYNIFASTASKHFIQKLSGRDCAGETIAQPSWYKEGDGYDLHNDFSGQRAVSFIWHLSKDWKPEWGGTFNWMQRDKETESYPASFNTLVLFTVTPHSFHSVSPVGPHHETKRLAVFGWWQSAWLPHTVDEIETALSSETERYRFTSAQAHSMIDNLVDVQQNLPPATYERLWQRLALLLEFDRSSIP